MSSGPPIEPRQRIVRAHPRQRRQLFIIFPAAIIVFFVPLLYAAKSPHAILTSVAIGIPIIVILGLLLLDALVTRLVVGADAIELIGLWSRQRLPVDEIAGWERVRGSQRSKASFGAVDIVPCVPGLKRLRIPDNLAGLPDVKDLLACMPELDARR